MSNGTTPTAFVSVSDIVRDYEITHAKLYRMIRLNEIPADAITREKYKGRQGWRHLVNPAAVPSLVRRSITAPVADASAAANAS